MKECGIIDGLIMNQFVECNVEYVIIIVVLEVRCVVLVVENVGLKY